MEDPDRIDQWRAYVETNLTAPFAACQACIPYMKVGESQKAEQVAVNNDFAGPCIIHVGSFRAQQSDPKQEGYAATKAGLVGLTQSMAISCKPLWIRINLIASGRIKVAQVCRDTDEKVLEWVQILNGDDVEMHPMNRAGKPEDIAHAAQFLIDAGFVTG
jgi:ribonuclease Z